MEIKKHQQTKPSIDFNNLSKKHLSIQLSLDGFSFCVINKLEMQIEKLQHFSFEDHSPTPDKLLQNVEAVFKKKKYFRKDMVR